MRNFFLTVLFEDINVCSAWDMSNNNNDIFQNEENQELRDVKDKLEVDRRNWLKVKEAKKDHNIFVNKEQLPLKD